MTADRHLLFGLLALQTGLIQQSQLVDAFHAWIGDKSRPLADHLIALGHLDAAQRSAVEALASLHVEAQGGDVETSLASVPAVRSTRESLAELGDPDLDATLSRVASGLVSPKDDESDPDRTASDANSATTSNGQRFRVLRPHAGGGPGAVFVARDQERHGEIASGTEHPGIVPVSAWRERASHWARRHRTGVTVAAVAVLVALIAMMAVRTAQIRANAKLKELNHNLENANRKLDDANAELAKTNERFTGAQAELKSANQRFTEAQAELKSANQRERQRLDLVINAIQLSHHDVSEDLLVKDKAFASLRSKLRKGLADYYDKLEQLLKDPSDPASRAGADVRAARANYQCQLAAALTALGRLSEARAYSDEATAIRQELFDGDPQNEDDARGLAESLLRSGTVLFATGNPAKAAVVWGRAAELYEGHQQKGEPAIFQACCLGSMAGLAGVEGSGVTAVAGAAMADRAMAILIREVAGGYRDGDLLAIEPGLVPLRSRADFRLIMMDLAFPASPIAPQVEKDFRPMPAR